MKQECWMCDDTEQIIKEYIYWKLIISPNQYYLGRCIVVLKRHIEDLTEIKDDERDELFSIMKNLREVIINLFGANLFNYLSAGNITRHLHMHFIPRYNHEVEFEGQKFKDERWNKNYAPYPKDFETPKDILTKIKDKIREKLK